MWAQHYEHGFTMTRAQAIGVPKVIVQAYFSIYHHIRAIYPSYGNIERIHNANIGQY